MHDPLQQGQPPLIQNFHAPLREQGTSSSLNTYDIFSTNRWVLKVIHQVGLTQPSQHEFYKVLNHALLPWVRLHLLVSPARLKCVALTAAAKPTWKHSFWLVVYDQRVITSVWKIKKRWQSLYVWWQDSTVHRLNILMQVLISKTL